MSADQRVAMSLDDITVKQFLDDLAAKQPTPGGGAVAAVVTALAAALGRMVVNFSAGKKSLAAHADLHRDAGEQLTAHGLRAMALAAEDAEAFARLSELWKLDADDPRRKAEWTDAVRAAVAAPRELLDVCLDTLDLCGRLCGATNRMLASDLAIAAVLAEAAARAAAWNVRINLPQLPDQSEAKRLDDEVEAHLVRARQLAEGVECACRHGG